LEAYSEQVGGNHHLYTAVQTDYDQLVETLEDRLEAPELPLPVEFLNLLIPEMAIVINQLHVSDAAEVIRRASLETAIALCDFPDLNRRPLILEQLTPELAAPILQGLSADELAYILRRMSAHERYRLLPLVSPPVRKEVDQLLRYEDNTAGGIMTTEFVSLRGEMSVEEALEHIRRVAADRETIYACYVVE
jgi:magnesium transporter